jgi:hypothetical protein
MIARSIPSARFWAMAVGSGLCAMCARPARM